MKRICYTNDQGILSVVIPAPKAQLERVLGPLTEEAYKEHVITRCAPTDRPWRFIDVKDIPDSREFREAWVDTTESSTVDICCERAREAKLALMRERRNALLDASDKDFMAALESGDVNRIGSVKAHRKKLRDATEALKSLDVAGQVNNIKLLDQIKTLSDIGE